MTAPRKCPECGRPYEMPLHSLGSMARRLGVKSDWLRQEAESGRIPAVQAGDRFIFDPDAVESVLRERAKGGNP